MTSLHLVSFPNISLFLQLSNILKLPRFNFYKGSWSNISKFSALFSYSSMSFMYSDLFMRTVILPLSAFVQIKYLFFSKKFFSYF